MTDSPTSLLPVYNFAEGNAAGEWWDGLNRSVYPHSTQEVWAISEWNPTLLSGTGGTLRWSDGGSSPLERRYYVEGPDFAANVDPSGYRLVVNVLSSDFKVASRVIETFRSLFPSVDPIADAENVYVHFWTFGTHGPQARIRRIAVPTWDQVRPNYPTEIQPYLDKLHDLDATDLSGGKIIVWHGIPGTGKTWALRSLAQAWRPWADLHYIVDPERFFGDKPTYMMDVVLNDDLTALTSPEKRWKVVILEDSGELLAADAKAQIGQSLSRLLNTADGLIGQGLRTLFLVTTNEEIGKLHEAVTRQGRCLAKIKFPPFSPTESRSWLDERGLDSPVGEINRGTTLADLYAKLGNGSTIKAEGESGVGFVRL
jgi:hypothetical protein